MQLHTVLEWPHTLRWAPSGLPLRFLQVSSSLWGGGTPTCTAAQVRLLTCSFVKLPGGWSGPALLAREIFMPWIICFVNWIIIIITIIGTLAHANPFPPAGSMQRSHSVEVRVGVGVAMGTNCLGDLQARW